MSRPRGSPSNRGRGARARGRKAAVLPSRMKIETSSTQRFTIRQTVAGPDKSITSTSTVLLDNARPAKRQKIDEMESDGSNHPDGDGKEPTAKKSGKKGQQAMSVKLKDFVTNLDRIIDKLIAKEAHLDIGEPCHCEHSKAFEIGDGIPGERLKNVRCTDCFQSSPSCRACFLKTHEANPFHWAEMWNGSFFVRIPQSALGRVVHLGHSGRRCPCPVSNSKTFKLTVVTMNGVHLSEVRYCNCLTAGERWEQLLDESLFPGTITAPETAIHVDVLKHFDILCSTSKLAAMDFVRTLRQVTNNAFPAKVPDFEKLFRRVMRIWRMLQMRKRAGEFHGIQTKVDLLGQYFIALKCPACPHLGINISIEELVAIIKSGDLHKAMLYLSGDGNYHQPLKKKINDKDDIQFMAVFHAFVEAFDAYSKELKAELENNSTCANLKAAKLQNFIKFKNFIVSGIVAFKCARHDFFLPGAVVDLHRGESFAYTDFAFRQALEPYKNYPLISACYDIACQYCKKIVPRFEKSFSDFVDTVKRIRYFTPKLHAHGHTDFCRYQYALDFADHVGRTHGERIESCWAEANLAGPSTSEMNPGHRRDTLASHFNGWNYRQLIQLASFLGKSIVSARKMRDEKAKQFKELAESMGHARIDEWSKLSTMPVVKNGDVTSVFKPKTYRVPSLDAIEKRLQSSTTVTAKVKSATRTSVKFLSDGMKLETALKRLKHKKKKDYISARVKSELEEEAMRLRETVKSWRHDQALFMPEFNKIRALRMNTDIEDEVLLMPSQLPPESREYSWFPIFQMVELELRKGQANEAISGLRTALKYRASTSSRRRKVVHGNASKTRAMGVSESADLLVKHRVSTYRHARKAMLSLGLDAKDKAFPPLRDEDVRVNNPYQYKKLGSGKQLDSWIWTMGPRGEIAEDEEDECEEDGNRVEWFRARQDARQWKEEVEILEAELERTRRFFMWMSGVWEKLATDQLKPGYTEYALEKASIFAQRAEECIEARKSADKVSEAAV